MIQWTAKLWNLETEQEIFQLEGEVMYHLDGDERWTSSFDKTVKIWDTYNDSLIEDFENLILNFSFSI